MSLPADITQLVFDELSLHNLLVASHVCTEWRTLAHGHPTFARNIDFIYHRTTWPPASAIDFLIARTGATNGALKLTLFISGVPQFTKEIILPLLAQCLHRVVELRVMVHWSAAADLLLALERPAPLLTWLRMGALNPDNVLIPELSPQFLGGTAARLETFYTHGFDGTSGTTVIPALTATKSLIYEPHDLHPPDSALVQRMMALLPNLEKLNMTGISWPSDSNGYHIVAPLRRLEIDVGPVSTSLLAAFASPDLEYLSAEGPCVDAAVFDIMVLPLAGDLTLEIACRREMMDIWFIRLRDARQKVRQMNYWDAAGESVDGDISNLVPLYHGIAHRITHASLPIVFWDVLVGLVTELPALTTLVLSSVTIRDSRVLDPIGCPKLKTLDICSMDREPIHVPWLANFLGHTLGCAVRARLTLLIRGCQLDGDPDMVWGYCDEIRLLRP